MYQAPPSISDARQHLVRRGLPALPDIVARITHSAVSRQETAIQLALCPNPENYPKRCFHPRPPDRNVYVLPMKQTLFRNRRLMPGTRCMLALLTGWAGTGKPICTTQGIIARHMGISVRQVYRYIQDAAREGYLRYGYTRSRIGLLTGIRIFLAFPALRPQIKKRTGKPAFPARTLPSDTNTQVKDSYERVDAFVKNHGVLPAPS